MGGPDLGMPAGLAGFSDVRHRLVPPVRRDRLKDERLGPSAGPALRRPLTAGRGRPAPTPSAAAGSTRTAAAPVACGTSSLGCPASSAPAALVRWISPSTMDLARHRSDNDPSVCGPLSSSAGAHISVHSAGIRLLEPSGRTKHSSRRPSLRIQPNTANVWPSKGCRHRTIVAVAGRSRTWAVCRLLVRPDRPLSPYGPGARSGRG